MELKSYKTRDERRRERTERIDRLIAEGVTAPEDIARTIDCPVKTIRSLLSKLSHKIEELADLGLPLGEIARQVACDNTTARDHIIKRGIYPEWKKAREEYRKNIKERQEELRETQEDIKRASQNLVNALVSIMCEKASIAERSAIKYYYGKKRTNVETNLEKLIKLFGAYYDSKKRNEAVPLRELARSSELNPKTECGYVRFILSRAGLSPLSRKMYSKEIKEAITRAFALDMSAADIAYFLKIEGCTAQYYYRKRLAHRKFNHPIKHAWFGNKSGSACALTYRIASQVYEAQDAEFNPAEISELLCKKQEIVDYAIHHRAEIGGKIIHALNIIYLRKHDKPYSGKEDDL